MTRFSPLVLRRYLLGGRINSTGCLRRQVIGGKHLPSIYAARSRTIQELHTNTESAPASTNHGIQNSFKAARKQPKDEGVGRNANPEKLQSLDEWELTVGIEIHAQLNTERKLFSYAAASFNDPPNTHVAYFDVALPGSMPIFQRETLIPAIRGALALNCNIQRTSRFDRKHYFHWDQPAGYQITQYYEPFAKDGYITLYAHDGIAKEDGDEIRIGIKQVQMEQDTAKTISQPGDIHLLDFNRVGLPLIEIISLPQIHHPSTAAAFVRKVQMLLSSVDACVLGMQSGGLRADVNVSVKRRTEEGSGFEYAGVQGLGQRTEIKNLSSFKSIEDAIIAERDRQISVLEEGGVIEGETRGYAIGSTETRRLRGKEGEVDYRYMPDPDLAPVIIDQELTQHLGTTLGVLPDEELAILESEYGVTVKDAIDLVSLNEGGRVEYFRNVVDVLTLLNPHEPQMKLGKWASNWVLHELGALISDYGEDENPLKFTSYGECIISHSQNGHLIHYLNEERITGKTAKKVLKVLFENGQVGGEKSVEDIIEGEQLWLRKMEREEYEELARRICEEEKKTVGEILAGKDGKINFLLGKMMRGDKEGRVQPLVAREVLREVVEGFRDI
ncbi:similar to glutamyl-tRNA(gln) amidotransferase subunit B [Botrytis cinerea T4]|uniref:Glutamyl-tRNA(Gln) amidotransferase subunit B, mitochondrial n=1 Tax=Botryotinia fuckeliana (strain T4) TaxID=999810 RepID=G2YEM3_BOTF4|nr:similar to glutamyl-tRNA(gln) amidotransferase subunit B [Botrytis cinerea T4]